HLTFVQGSVKVALLFLKRLILGRDTNPLSPNCKRLFGWRLKEAIVALLVLKLPLMPFIPGSNVNK
ncbi:putative ATP-dependent RNA helicase spindle-E, partial [Clarias magur]